MIKKFKIFLRKKIYNIGFENKLSIKKSLIILIKLTKIKFINFLLKQVQEQEFLYN